MDWSRSRYWLCHFLNSRHQRPAITSRLADDAGGTTDAPVPSVVLQSWLSERWPGDDLGDVGFIAAAARRYADDPAYVQSLRLLAKERGYWAGLIRGLRRDHRLPTPAVSRRRQGASDLALRLTRRLGPRFEMSVLMLTALVHQRLIAALGNRVRDPVAAGVIALIQREQSDHLAFYIERLTFELADLHFVRRSLRRLRMRLLFAGFLADAIHSHGPLLRSLGLSRRRFALAAWRQFESALARAVPYRRRQLLTALLAQRQRPYEPAPRL